MKRKYAINALTGDGIDEAIRGLRGYQKWLEEKAREMVRRLTDFGVTVANAGFESAVYDGTNDFNVTFEERGGMTRAVVATGATVLFVEWGTGVTYPDNHPERPEGVLGRGEYGKGHGKQHTWGYYGDDPGTNGVVKHTKRGDVILTHGNPANMPMYNARKSIEQEFITIAREVFG